MSAKLKINGSEMSVANTTNSGRDVETMVFANIRIDINIRENRADIHGIMSTNVEVKMCAILDNHSSSNQDKLNKISIAMERTALPTTLDPGHL